MKIGIFSLPNISDCIECTATYQLSDDLTIIVLFKPQPRGENDIIIDIYKNDISDANKIISGKILALSSLLCQPRTDIDFPYYLYCYDTDGTGLPLNQFTLQNFYFQFNNFEDGSIAEDTESEE